MGVLYQMQPGLTSPRKHGVFDTGEQVCYNYNNNKGGTQVFMQQDWLMRQIEMMTMAIAKLLFGKDGEAYDLKEVSNQGQSSELRQKLTALLREGQLGEAENLLFFELDKGDERTLAVAVDFYKQANTFSDRELEAQGFTRTELWEGLGEVVKRYGLYIPGFWDEP